MNLFWYKAIIKRFGFNSLHQVFDIMIIVHIAMDTCRDINTLEGMSDFLWRTPHGAVANVLDCNIVVIEFEFQTRYYVHFWTITLGKIINLLIPTPSYGLYDTSKVFRQEWFW